MIEDQFFFRDVNSGFLGHAFVQLAVPFSKALDDGPFRYPRTKSLSFQWQPWRWFNACTLQLVTKGEEGGFCSIELTTCLALKKHYHSSSFPFLSISHFQAGCNMLLQCGLEPRLVLIRIVFLFICPVPFPCIGFWYTSLVVGWLCTHVYTHKMRNNDNRNSIIYISLC